jgi:uncharacterized protein
MMAAKTTSPAGNTSASPAYDMNELQTAWTSDMIVAAFRTVATMFESDVPSINALNVFPVPDGDTGTNMSLTLRAAIAEVDRAVEKPGQAGDVLRLLTRGALMGARGNSGVILYQIIAGFAAGADGAEFLDGPTLARCFGWSSELAYRGVNNPVEGTMLTVMREVADSCRAAGQAGDSLASVLTTARQASEVALAETPNQLAILRQAGVVDAGGQGVVTILRILERFSRGEIDQSTPASAMAASGFAASMHFLDQADVIHGLDEFGYCINFMVTGQRLQEGGIRGALDEIGTSMVMVGDDTALKIHIHSEHPGVILEEALRFGELHDIRIDNMKAQTQRLMAERDSRVTAYQFEQPSGMTVEIGLVAVASGEGIIDAFRGMGAHAVVPGGPTMNPSIEQLREAVEGTPHQTVFILPNDSNIIATARHVESLTDKTVRVVPTTSIPQGIVALATFNFNADMEQNLAAMTEAIQDVRSLAITRASRDAEIDGIRFREDEFMGLLDGTPRATGADPAQLVLDLVSEAGAEDYELATVFIGEPADDDLAERVEEAVNERFPDLEVEITPGGQPHYDLLISLE